MILQHRTGWPLLLGRNDSGKVPGEKKSPLPRRIPSASLMLPSERPGCSALLTHGLSSAHSYSDHHDATVPPPCRPFAVLAGPEDGSPGRTLSAPVSFVAHLIALAAFAFALMRGVLSIRGFRRSEKAGYILDPNQ
jgi:hypothetical protein